VASADAIDHLSHDTRFTRTGTLASPTIGRGLTWRPKGAGKDPVGHYLVAVLKALVPDFGLIAAAPVTTGELGLQVQVGHMSG
jgi:hypothetical protein